MVYHVLVVAPPPPPPLLLCGQRIKPIKYKILIRIDVDLFCCASLLDWMIVTPKHHTPIN